jgi:hypothetical protein
MQADLEPLDVEAWFERIEMIATGLIERTEHGLRHAFHLLQLTPREFRPPQYWQLNEQAFEALLDGGQLETAARQLLCAPGLTVTTVYSAHGVEAAVRCRTLKRTTYGRGDSPAAAILDAWARCLLSLNEDFGSEHFKNALTASA